MVVVAEWLVSVLALIVSIVFFVITFSFPQTNADPGGLALFPRVLCFLTGGSSLLLIISLLKRPTAREALAAAIGNFAAAWRKDTSDEASGLTRLTTYIFVLSIVYPVFVVLFGFLAATIVYIFTLMKLLRSKTWVSALFSVFLGGGIYYIFGVLLEVSLSVGMAFERFWD